MKRTDPTTGRTTEARNKPRAIYILGQVYHSLGQAVAAIREYTRVADQIPMRNRRSSTSRAARLRCLRSPTIRPGEPTTVKANASKRRDRRREGVSHQLDEVHLLRQNLSELTKNQPRGIRPLHETTVELGDGKDYRDRERDLALPLEEEGAYFIVCRGENLHAGGFVIVTPLAVEVQEDAVSERFARRSKTSSPTNPRPNVL